MRLEAKILNLLAEPGGGKLSIFGSAKRVEAQVRLVEASNSAAVDLFPIRHAEKVLAAFGRAFGTLPDNLSEVNQEQKSFITQSVAGLAEDGKVICVRLALFAEMMKGKSWTPATLKEVGGTKGVGVTFLEETFSASTSPPEHRYHQKAARAVLKDLLPESGTDIKGAHAILCRVAGSLGLWESPQGLRRPDPHSGQRNPADHARPTRKAKDSE